MHSHHITQMVHVLKPVLKNRPKAQAILERYWRNRMAIVWEIADVHRAANECEVALTNEEGRIILERLLDKHDAQYGICWQTLTSEIDGTVLGRKLTERELNQFVAKDIITIQK